MDKKIKRFCGGDLSSVDKISVIASVIIGGCT